MEIKKLNNVKWEASAISTTIKPGLGKLMLQGFGNSKEEARLHLEEKIKEYNEIIRIKEGIEDNPFEDNIFKKN